MLKDIILSGDPETHPAPDEPRDLRLKLGSRLEELIQKLDALGPRPSHIDLVGLVRSARLDMSDLAPFVRTSLQSYNRAPVVVREHYEMLVLTWSAGQASVPHEHSGSVCVVRVMQGDAAEASYSIATDGFVDWECEERVRTGEVTSLHDAGVHTIRNASTDAETLVTLHVYAPPLRDGRRFVPRREPRSIAYPSAGDGMPTIAIVGGGFCGSMTAAHLLRSARCPMRITVIERRGAMGEGVAYATRESAHLLNVPAGKMSAWAGNPDDFLTWAQKRRNDVAPTDFIPREWYGDYIRDTLRKCAKSSLGSLSIEFDEVRRIVRHPEGGSIIHLARGASLRADAVVLAVGHSPPSDPIGHKWIGSRARYVTDPWRPFAMSAVRGDEPIVMLGSGLTAVDTVMSLTEYPRSARITLVSINGLTPRGHAEFPSAPADLSALVSDVLREGVRTRRLSRELRKLAEEFVAAGRDWRNVVDGLRPHTASLWRGMPIAERRRFLRLRPFWEVHRHRTAPEVSTRLASMLRSGQVEVIAGRVASVHVEGDQLRVLVRRRRTRDVMELRAGWVVNCTGPLPSNRPESNPAIGSLMVRGQLCLDPLALGVETTECGHAVAADRTQVSDTYVVGTLRKPSFWESTAVPELREQVATVAGQLLGRFTGGEKSSQTPRA
jgi:uncharacterized NAD(P)/FAD-binding protein YdhS